jgi:hypothetical protein
MLFYLTLALVLGCLFLASYYYPHFDKLFGFIILLLLILIGGLRDGIGWDYPSYVDWYINGSRDEGLHGLEIGFLVLMNFLRFFTLHYNYLFFIIAFLTYFYVYLGVRRYAKEQTLPMVLYFLIPSMFLYSFTLIRQFLAVAITFYCFNLLLDKKFILFTLLMLMAISVHYSSALAFIIFLIVYFLVEKIKFYHMYILLFVSFFISQIGIIYLIEKFLVNSHYVYYVSNQAVPVPYLKLLVLNVMAILVLYFYQKNGFSNFKQKYFLILYFFSICLINLFSESIDLTRISIYFRIYEILLICPIIYYTLQKRRIILIFFLFSLYFFPFVRTLILDSSGRIPNENKLVPYQSILVK